MERPSWVVVVLWLLLGAFVLVAPVYIGFSWAETYESRHPDYDSVREAELIERGWLPPILPESVRDVRQLHILDENRVWFCFSLPTDRKKRTFVGGLDEIPPARLGERTLPEDPSGNPLSRLYLPTAEWWPAWLRFEGPLGEARPPEVRYFTFEQYTLAAHAEELTVCGWGTR